MWHTGPLSESIELLKHVVGDDQYGKAKGYRASIQGMPQNYLGGHHAIDAVIKLTTVNIVNITYRSYGSQSYLPKL